MSAFNSNKRAMRCPRATGSPSRFLSPSPTSTDRLDFYEKVFGGRILSRGDSKGASGHIQIANTWLIVNVGGGPTPDKPTVTLSVLADPDQINSFMNFALRIFKRAMSYGKVEERSSSPSRSRRFEQYTTSTRKRVSINVRYCPLPVPRTA